ncbi:polyprenyl synthetase family protein [Patescibacteria group bacterium]
MDSNIDFAKEYLQSVKTNIDEKIENTLNEEIRKAKEIYPPHVVAMFEAYADVARRGGKRLRAAMTYATYKMMGGQNEDVAYEIGVIIELIHAYILVLDDFIDKSANRRGGPTAHELIKTQLSEYQNDEIEHFGNSFASIAAIIGSHLSFRLISEMEIDADTKNRINQKIHETIITTGYGEILDVYASLTQNISEQEITNMLKWKTSVYTFENPMHVGAILAGTDDHSIFESISKFSLPLGIAFQIKDDMLAIFGDSTETGKSNLDDLKEGKITLLVQHCLENGSEEQKEQIKAMLGNTYLDETELEIVRVILTDSGSYDYATTMAENYIGMAKTIVEEEFPESTPEEEKRFLLGIAEYILARNK